MRRALSPRLPPLLLWAQHGWVPLGAPQGFLLVAALAALARRRSRCLLLGSLSQSVWQSAVAVVCAQERRSVVRWGSLTVSGLPVPASWQLAVVTDGGKCSPDELH